MEIRESMRLNKVNISKRRIKHKLLLEQHNNYLYVEYGDSRWIQYELNSNGIVVRSKDNRNNSWIEW